MREFEIETEPRPEDARVLEDLMYAHNVKATGFADGKLLAIFSRGGDGSANGGMLGWTWGGTCYVRFLFVPEHARNRGQGRRLMAAVEGEARARGCIQIILETHDFQVPEFYRKLGFEIVGRIAGYPAGHQQLTMRKRLSSTGYTAASIDPSVATSMEEHVADDKFNMSLRKFLKHVGVTSQQEIERVVRERSLRGKGTLKVKVTLTAEGTALNHVVDGEIDLS